MLEHNRGYAIKKHIFMLETICFRNKPISICGDLQYCSGSSVFLLEPIHNDNKLH